MDEKNKQTTDSDTTTELFREHLSQHGMRLTNQRKAILQAVLRQTQHFTAEDLLAKAKHIDVSVSRATVYRSLPVLMQSKIIREVDVGRDFKYYAVEDKRKSFQAQVICRKCGKIMEIDAPFMDWYGKAVAEKLGMEAVSQRLQVEAMCRDPEHCVFARK